MVASDALLPKCSIKGIITAARNALPSKRSIKGITYGCSRCSADEMEYKKYHTWFLAMLCHVRREYKRSGITATSSDEKKKESSGFVFTLLACISTAGDTRALSDAKKKKKAEILSRSGAYCVPELEASVNLTTLHA